MKETSVKNCYVTDKMFTPDFVGGHFNKTFVFGDNERHIGMGGQAIIRKMENSIGIRTKKSPSYDDDAFWSDDDYDKNVKMIDEDISAIKYLLYNNLSVVFSSHGYGNGFADLPNRASLTYEYLIKTLNTEFGTTYNL